MAVLQLLKGQTPGQIFALERESSVLGRHPDCDIVLDVQAVSRQHAKILRSGADFYVEDMESRNGTFVNGEKIEARRLLRDNDRLKICNLLFTFRLYPPGMSDSSRALLVDDEGPVRSSTMTSQVDVGNPRTPARMSVNPELKLRAMLEITQSLSKAFDLEEVLPKILQTLGHIFVQADRGFVVLRSEPSNMLIPAAVWHRRGDDQETIRISRTIVNQVMTDKLAILSADAASDDRFDTSQSIADFRIRSMMCAPLLDSDGKAQGVIQIDTLDQRSRFQQDDLDLLASVAWQAALAIENAQNHEQLLTQRALERDLVLAHQVQQALLPDQVPVLPGYQFFSFYEPANQVGGDYYGYIPMPGGRLAVVIADVAGKGISAALLMAKLSAEVGYLLATEATPADALNRLNVSFVRVLNDRFVTMAIVVIDPARHEVTIVNAGHMAPLLCKPGGQVVDLGEDTKGIPIGIEEDHRYEQCVIPLSLGDTVTIYTDGISEAMNGDLQQYGIDRIVKDLCKRSERDTVDKLAGSVLEDVKRFVGDQDQSDDMCLVCFGRC
ncbi:MAG: SpoIIE family protein phosphatase [Planctomycetia bacterium]|nr:SpoIIE family protein phosphatase [Planctomycetia bacterium]